jgi:hypothetical protein
MGSELFHGFQQLGDDRELACQLDVLQIPAFAILDGKEVFIHTEPMLPNWVGTPCLRTTNICLVGVIQKCFNYLWSEAETPKIQQITA